MPLASKPGAPRKPKLIDPDSDGTNVPVGRKLAGAQGDYYADPFKDVRRPDRSFAIKPTPKHLRKPT